jgi:hypothetical protein
MYNPIAFSPICLAHIGRAFYMRYPHRPIEMTRSLPPTPPGGGLAVTSASGRADGRRVLAERQGTSPSPSLFDYPSLPPFGHKWLSIPSTPPSPPPSTARSYFYHTPTRSLYLAYGEFPTSAYSSEFWRLSLDTGAWTCLSVSSSPRSACASELIGDRIWFFGGVTQDGPIQDLHYVDLTSLEVVRPTTTGELPPAGSHPFMVHWHDSLVLWANTPGGSRSAFYILDTRSGQWTRVASEFVYRLGSTGTVVGDTLYVFGSSIEMTVLTLDLKRVAIANVRTSGIEPSVVEHITTVAVGEVIFAFETRGEAALTRLFVFECGRLAWHSYGVECAENVGGAPEVAFYDELERRIVAVCEKEGIAGVTQIQVGESLGVLSHTFDMLGQLG